MDDIKRPGCCPDKDIWEALPGHLRRWERFCIVLKPPYADIGVFNPKIKYISEKHNFEYDSVITDDFNFNRLPDKQYGTIFCFEMVEHFQNPLFFMNELKRILDKDGRIYVSMPGRPQFLWTKYHFYEMTPKRFNKWILVPLDLMIVRKKMLRTYRKKWWFHFKGFRPLLRIYYDYTWIYEIKHN
jgi:SAM-dependent methyltransferase